MKSFLYFTACCFALLAALSIIPLQSLAGDYRLPSDYYSKGRGVQDLDVLRKLLAKDDWTDSERKTLEELVRFSTVGEISRNEKSIGVFAARGNREKHDADIQSAELFFQLNIDLKEQREMVFTNILEHLPLFKLDEGRKSVLSGFREDSEIRTLLPAVLEALKSGPDHFSLTCGILDSALRKGFLSGVNGEDPVIKGIVVELRKEAASNVEGECLGNSVRSRSRMYLVTLGDKFGKQILEQTLARALDPAGDVTSLSYAAPEAFSLIEGWPDPDYMAGIIAMGGNIKRLRHDKMDQFYFKRVASLVKYAKSKPGWNFEPVLVYLDKESEDANYPNWSSLADTTLRKIRSGQ